MSYQPNRVINVHIFVGVSGLNDANFTKVLYQDGAVSAVVIGLITEIGASGVYTCQFTPDAAGDWDPIFLYLGVPYGGDTPYNVVDLAAMVNAQVLDVMNVDTFAEMAALPAVTPTILEMIRFTYQFFRYKKTSTATQEKLFKADDTTVIGTAGLSDDGTTFVRTEVS